MVMLPGQKAAKRRRLIDQGREPVVKLNIGWEIDDWVGHAGMRTTRN